MNWGGEKAHTENKTCTKGDIFSRRFWGNSIVILAHFLQQ